MLNNRRTLTMDWYLPSPKWMFLINASLLLLHVSVAKILEPILWDKHLFQRNGPGGFRIEAGINDTIDIICPRSNDTLSPRNVQYHKFTQVSERGYENCDLRDGGGKTLLRCNRPFVENELVLLLQEDTVYPGDPVFHHGQDYYFITTANGTEEGIDQVTGGLCQSHYMKLIIHITGEDVTGTVPNNTGKDDEYKGDNGTSSPSSTGTTPNNTGKDEYKGDNRPSSPSSTGTTPNNTGKDDEYKGDNGKSSPSSMLILICSSIAFEGWLWH